MPLDYSRWNNIEVSDDEDDTHPNIDTPSLFRWRHTARLERDAEFKREKEEIEKQYKLHLENIAKCRQDLSEAKDSNQINELEKKMAKLLKDDKDWEKKNEEFNKKERLKPLNIDTICKEGKSFTAINHVKDEKKVEEEDPEQMVDKMRSFIKKYDKEIKQFGMFQRPQDTKDFLMKNPYLVCDETANHLLLWCIDLSMEEKKNLMYHVSHQCVLLQFILELAKFKKADPKSMISIFFTQFLNPQPEYKEAFQAELDAFRNRVESRAKVKLEEAAEQYEEIEKQKRLGPGGLDPLEVMESLPPELRECFETKDVQLLKDVLGAMPRETAEEYYKKCVDSGLWVEKANSDDDAEQDEPEHPVIESPPKNVLKID